MTSSTYVFLSGIAAIICTAVLVTADSGPAGCYYCHTDADGSACNTPLNASAVRIQMCSNLSIVDSTSDLTSATNATDYVCSLLTYSQSGALVTIRGCERRQVSNTDLCTHLTQTVASTGYVTNFACSTCNTNLCNAASLPNLSLSILVAGIFMAFHHH